jgi:peptide/nickel transport system substrate-binding protein
MVRHIRWQILLVVMGTILAGVLLSYQAVGIELELVPASGGTLVEALVGQPQYLNPLLSQNNPVDRDICALVFEGLTRYDEHGQLVPALASGWNISGDGLVYTFWLRQDVRWQDGIGFSADDVLFTIQLLQDPGYTGPADLGVLWNSVEVERLNRWTVTMTLQEPFAPFLDYTTIGMLPVHLLDGVTAAELPDQPFNGSPIGTGPFRVEESDWESGRLLLSANGLYREGKIPKLSGVEFQFFSDYGSALTAYEGGQVNSVGKVIAADMPRARALGNINLYTSSLPRETMILLNLQSEELSFFQDKRVRQALLMGLDRPTLIADILSGQGMVAHSPIFPGSWAYFGEVMQYEHDPERAAQRLDGAGWLLPEENDSQAHLVESEMLAGGVRTREERELSFSLLAAANTTHELLANEIAHQWGEMGIRVTVDPVEPGRISERLEAGDFQAALIDVDMRGDPDLYSLWSESAVQEGQNYGGWRHREASELLEQARQLTNVGQRTTRYYHFQQIFAEEVPALLLYFQTYTYGISDQVQQVSIGPLTTPSDRFASISDWFLVWREVVIRKSSPRLGDSW